MPVGRDLDARARARARASGESAIEDRVGAVHVEVERAAGQRRRARARLPSGPVIGTWPIASASGAPGRSARSSSCREEGAVDEAHVGGGELGQRWRVSSAPSAGANTRRAPLARSVTRTPDRRLGVRLREIAQEGRQLRRHREEARLERAPRGRARSASSSARRAPDRLEQPERRVVLAAARGAPRASRAIAVARAPRAARAARAPRRARRRSARRCRAARRACPGAGAAPGSAASCWRTSGLGVEQRPARAVRRDGERRSACAAARARRRARARTELRAAAVPLRQAAAGAGAEHAHAHAPNLARSERRAVCLWLRPRGSRNRTRLWYRRREVSS